jgi:outer membrane receptor protein involved in Fe transport
LLGWLTLSAPLLATALPATALSVSGRVLEAASGQPLEYATVSLYALDSTVADGGITDGQGQFQLDAPKGTYRLVIEFMGFVPLERRVDLPTDANLGDLFLEADRKTLETVEVRAERSQMNLHLDKKVFNVGEDALAQGGSANQVLAQVPSVAVSAEGVVSLRGSSGVRILINGRPSALADNNSLDAIPASSIERIELITNPSARYEAAGTAGIINIILKKERERGYGGSLTVGTGYPADHQALLNLNYRHEKFSAFANLGGRWANFRGDGELTRTTVFDGDTTKLSRIPDMDRQDRAWSALAGLDYRPNERTTLTASYSVYDVVNDDFTRNDYFFSDGAGRSIRTLQQDQDYLEPGTYEQLDLIYAYDYGQDKLTLQFNHDAWREVETEEVSIEQLRPEPETLVNYRTETRERSRDFRLQGDYERQIGEHGTFEAGLRAETRIISADYLAEREVEEEQFATIPGFDNLFDYYERIGSAYVQYGREGERLGWQFGLRNEYTFIRGENDSEDLDDFEKRYNRLFPSASLKYSISEVSSSQLSYSRRIRRPHFGWLNPFSGLRLPSSIFFGNPDLDPTYTDRVELNWLARLEKVTLNPAIYGGRTLGYMEVAVEQQAENIFGLNDGTILSRPVNLDREYTYGIEITGNYRPTEALTLAGDANYRGYSIRGAFAGRSFDFDFATWSAGLRIQYRMNDATSAQLRVGYNARNEDVQSVEYGTWNGEAALSRTFGDRVTLTANVRAPRYFRNEVFRPTFRQEDYFQWTGWRYGLNLAYRFERGADSAGRQTRGSIR